MHTNVTTKIILWTYKATKGDIYPVKLRVTYKGDVKYYGHQYGLKMRLTQKEFDAMMGRSPRGENRERREFVDSYERAVQQIITGLGHFGFTFEKLEEVMRGPAKIEKVLLVDALEEYCGRGKSEKTKELYQYTADLIRKYKPRLVVSGVSVATLEELEDVMYKKKNSDSTVSMHMRHIRAVMRKAARQNLIDESRIPFGPEGYVIPAPKHSKKLSKKEDIRNLLTYRTKFKKLQLARDVWVFCFLLGGANPVDVFSLKRENLSDGVIRFNRTKTGRAIEIPVIPMMGEIISRQQSGRYLFPVVKKDFRKDCKTARRVINDRLRKILGKPDISLSHARNSFASYSAASGMSLLMTGNMMGHTGGTTTHGYMSVPIEEKREKLIKLEKYFIE